MATIPQPFLFSWKEIDEASDLDRLRLVLSALPDESLVSFLEQRRGRGRDDYPIRSMWNAVIAGVVFQHPSAAALLRELRRNGELRQLCGLNPFGGERSAPSDDAMERFLMNMKSNQSSTNERCGETRNTKLCTPSALYAHRQTYRQMAESLQSAYLRGEGKRSYRPRARLRAS